MDKNKIIYIYIYIYIYKIFCETIQLDNESNLFVVWNLEFDFFISCMSRFWTFFKRIIRKLKICVHNFNV